MYHQEVSTEGRQQHQLSTTSMADTTGIKNTTRPFDNSFNSSSAMSNSGLHSTKSYGDTTNTGSALTGMDEFFSKANALMESSKNYRWQTELGPAEKQIMSKYIDMSAHCPLKTDGQIEDIIKRYSDPISKTMDLCNMDTSRSLKHPMYPSKSNLLLCKSTTYPHSMAYSDMYRPELSNPNPDVNSKLNQSSKIDTCVTSTNSDIVSPNKSSNRMASSNQLVSIPKSSTGNERNSGKNKESSNTMKPKKSTNKSSNDLTNNSCQCGSGKAPSQGCPVHCPPKATMDRKVCEPKCVQPCTKQVSTQKKGGKKAGGAKSQTTQNRFLQVQEAKRSYKENQKLRLEGMELRKEMECTRKGLMVECAKVLHSVLSFCEERSKKNKATDRNSVTGAKPCAEQPQ